MNQKPNSSRAKTVSFFALAVMIVAVSGGCRAMFHKNPNGKVEDPRERAKYFYIGDVTASFGLDNYEIQGVALVTSLAGTGSDPAPSVLRDQLLKEMSSRDTRHPNTYLASPNTSMVIATGYLKPGIKKGEHFDILVTLPEMSETTSLRGGYMLKATLSDYLVTNRVMKGWDRAQAAGPVLVEPRTGTDKDKVMQRRGRILSGGVCQMDRVVGLRVLPDAVRYDRLNTMKIEKVVNRRFQTVGNNGLKETVAKAKDDKFVELYIPSLYKDNLRRFLDVVRCLPLRESEADMMARLIRLQKQLHEPVSAARAAMELEAIGTPAVDTLRTGLDSREIAVRFHAAQALAYLDVDEAAPTLGKIAAEEPSYRYNALMALRALNNLYAEEELKTLMNLPTAETRYGAFRTLTEMRPDDPLVKGMKLGKGTFTLCVVNSTAPPMIHVTRSYRAEVVIFGQGTRFSTPLAVEGANNIVVRSASPDEIVISKFAVNQPPQQRTVSARVDEVINALSDVGATYPDVLEILQAAVGQGALPASMFRVDALPSDGRASRYEKEEKKQAKKDARKPGENKPAAETAAETQDAAKEREPWSPDGPETELAAQENDSTRQSAWFFGKKKEK